MSTPERRTRSVFLLLIGLVVAALAVALTTSVASAAPSPTTPPAPATAQKATSAVSPGAHPTRRACPDVTKPGLATCLAIFRTDVKAATGIQATTPVGYGPSDLASAYKLPSSTAGGGETVGIVDAFGYPNAEADLAVYRAQYGLPACTTANGCLTITDQRGGTNYPPPNANWDGEQALDLDMVSATCPLCHITLVESDDNSIANLGTGVNEAVSLGAKYVSNSYAGNEDPSELQLDSSFYDHPGVAVTASTDDFGYGAAYPATSPDVTAVGGTSLVQDSSARGWSETAWSGAGSGCSAFEPKPSFQTDTGCANRTEADVSAVADPNTPVAVYEGGWGIAGGTSVASPIIASVYALAGTPVADTHPNSYPYADTAALNDVTSGSNGTCSPSYLCTAGPGYDGPTGLGTPSGVSAFTTGPHGIVSGTVTDTTGTALPGAQVSVGDQNTTTDSSGGYTLSVPVGTYTVTATKFGYSTATRTGVTVTDGQTVTENLSVALEPTTTVSGLVRDGSGHGWPVYAQVQVKGQPTTATYTDPATGHYTLTVPQNGSYTVQVDPVYAGYVADSQQVTVGSASVGHDVSILVDQTTCSAPGYAFQYTGSTQTFDATTAPSGWSVTDNVGNGQTWEFTDAGGRGNQTGGTGGFAIVDSDHDGVGNAQDTSLVSPVLDFSSVASPYVQFANDYFGFPNQTGDVDYTIDGGATWQTVWSHGSDSVRGPVTEAVPLPNAAGQPAVQVRFHFTGHFGFWWQLDNVFLGNRVCAPTPGGLVVGHVNDANTGAGVNGALVASVAHPADKAVTSTSADPAQGAGWFWLFSSLTGSNAFAATAGNYVTGTQTVNVAPDWATPVTFSLAAGRLTTNTTAITKTVAWQGTASQTVKVTNTGSAPVDVKLNQEPGTFTPSGVQGAQLVTVKGNYSPGPMVGPRAVRHAATPLTTDVPSDAPWQTVADYPHPIMDNGVAAVGGRIYSFTGFDGTALDSTNYAYDPSTQAWSGIANIGTPREAPSVAAVGTKVYVVGGWGNDGNPVATLEIYDTTTDTWTTGAPIPTPYAASGIAVVGGKIYVVGGCSTLSCGFTDVQVYDPAANSWTAGPAFPAPVAWESCGGINGSLYCAGGDTDSAALNTGYSLDPASGVWSPIANLPVTDWAAGSTVSAGRLLMSGGVANGALTNAGWSYDPSSNTWTAVPNSNNTQYRGGSACGFYKIGGSTGNFNASPHDELLPGQDQCAETVSIPWLSVSPADTTLAPGKSATFTVTLNANVSAITQPGTFTASLAVTAPVPHALPAIPVTFTVDPPSTWGKITGTVTGLGCTSGSTPLAGATVQIDTWAATYTLKTDKNGKYQLWLDVRNNPLTVIVAKDNWQPQTSTVKIVRKQTVTANYALKPDSC